MTVTIERDAERESWNRLVERSSQTEVFHRYEALEVQADHADATLHPFVGYEDGEPVGLFPVFELRRGFVTTVLSPPPKLRVPYLGPAMIDSDHLDTYRTAERTREFVHGVLDRVDSSLSPRYVHLRTGDRYTDTRPLLWRDFRTRTRHTYVVDLTGGRETVLSSFSSDARKNVTGTDGDAYEITVGGSDAVRDIFRQVRARFERQDIDFAVPVGFAVDLYEQLPDGAVRPYVLRIDGEFVGGILALDDGDRVSRWQGGVRVGESDLPVNDLLDWRIMTDAMATGVGEYDLVGADNERISSYKAKFDPDLRSFTSLWRGSRITSLLARGYRKVP